MSKMERSLHFVETALDKYYNIEQQFTLSESESLHGLGQINNRLNVIDPTNSLIQITSHK